MEWTIKNCKTLRPTKLETNTRDIKYFRGSSESGKTNIWNAIRIIGAHSDLKRQGRETTPWHTERHGYDPN